MTHETPNDPRNPVIASVAFVGIVIGGLFIVGAVYLGANPNIKSTKPPISSSAHTGSSSETTGSGNNFR